MLKSKAVEVYNEECKKKGNGAGFFVVRIKYFWKIITNESSMHEEIRSRFQGMPAAILCRPFYVSLCYLKV